jgi:hypothetical protein
MESWSRIKVPGAVGLVGIAERCLEVCFLALSAVLAWDSPVIAQEALAVDLELVLAVDVSYSMDLNEQRAQREGYVEAFRDPEIIAAIASGARGRIAVAYVEWGGAALEVLPWTLIDGRDSADQFSAALREKPFRQIAFTSISRALLFARSLFRASPHHAARRVIDVSGDGPNNDGAPVELARNTLLVEGIAINGLVVMLADDAPTIPNLDAYFRDCVIGGDGAFVMTVKSANEFAGAIRQKLLLEISYPKLTQEPARPSIVSVRAAESNCLIGEEMLERGSE